MDDSVIDLYLFKAEQSLASAVGEQAQGRDDNRANRAYDACFQAAIAAARAIGARSG